MNGDWEWVVEPTESKPVGIARKQASLRRWRWHVVVIDGLTYSTDSEARARKIRSEELRRVGV